MSISPAASLDLEGVYMQANGFELDATRQDEDFPALGGPAAASGAPRPAGAWGSRSAAHLVADSSAGGMCSWSCVPAVGMACIWSCQLSCLFVWCRGYAVYALSHMRAWTSG